MAAYEAIYAKMRLADSIGLWVIGPPREGSLHGAKMLIAGICKHALSDFLEQVRLVTRGDTPFARLLTVARSETKPRSFHSVQTPHTGRAQVWYHRRCGRWPRHGLSPP